jgi:hypothetical protein
LATRHSVPSQNRFASDSPLEGTRFELSSLGHGYLELARPCPRLGFLQGNTHFSGATSSSTCQRSPRSPTPDPFSAWYPLDGNDLPRSWCVLSKFDGLVKRFRDNRQAVSAGTAEGAKSEHVRNTGRRFCPLNAAVCSEDSPTRIGRDHRSPNLTGGPPPLPHARARARWRGK